MSASRTSFLWQRSISHFRVYASGSPESFRKRISYVPEQERREMAAVFVDVLRATTTLVGIAAAGCEGIYLDEKSRTGEYLFIPPFLESGGGWVYGGEENGQPIQGTDERGNRLSGIISNSPCDVRRANFEGRRLRFYSTNGASALDAISDKGFAAVHAMCIANIEATIHLVLRGSVKRVWFVCGGFYGTGTLEDCIAVGWAIAHLLKSGWVALEGLDDEALMMEHVARQYLEPNDGLGGTLRSRQVGRLLSSIGHEADIEACVIGGPKLESGLWDRMRNTVLSVDSTRGKYLVPSLRTTLTSETGVHES